MSDDVKPDIYEKLMTDHDYDGIQELDNDLPGWWLILFYLTIIIGVVYIVYAEFINKESDDDRFNTSVAELKEMRASVASNDDNSGPSKDSAILAEGKKLFGTYCLSCHLADGGGLAGPNLTDDYWIHGATFEENVHIIKKGVIAKGMVAWENQLKPAQIYAVASYIYTLRGTTPAVAKAPQGKKYDKNNKLIEGAEAKDPVPPVVPEDKDPEDKGPENKDPENKGPETVDSGDEKAKGMAAAVGSSKDGAHIFKTLCAACHRPDGGGLVGPNLTDEFWVHGCTEEDLIKFINVGNPAKGMLPWKGHLTDKQIKLVSQYILSLKGTNPPNPKAAEGKKCE